MAWKAVAAAEAGAPLTDIPGKRRIPDIRIADARETGAAIVVACPNCGDAGGRGRPRPDVRDIAELVADALEHRERHPRDQSTPAVHPHSRGLKRIMLGQSASVGEDASTPAQAGAASAAKPLRSQAPAVRRMLAVAHSERGALSAGARRSRRGGGAAG